MPTPIFRTAAVRCLLLPFTALALPALAADAPSVEKCSQELGTLAVAEPQAHVMSGLSRYGLGSPAVMLRMLVQESGCFAVVERGVAMQNLQQERALAAQGQLQADANVGGGQMAVADFVMTPTVQFSGDTGGIGGAIGGLLGRAGGALGALGGLAGGVKFKEAETTLLVADVRSGIQVASAEGKASKMNFAVGGWGWGGLGWAGGGGFTKTPEGKLIAASLLDNYNKIVQSVRDKPSLVRARSEASRANAANSVQATPLTPAAPAATLAPAGVVVSPAPRDRVVVAPGTVVLPNVAAPGYDAALPAGMFGAFTGQYNGSEQGTLSLVVGTNGQVTGFGQSPRAGNLQVGGAVQANGTMLLMAVDQKQAVVAQFTGFINPNTGDIIGTWRSSDGNAQGQFSGKRQ
ncbi:CsgG/HfaB family protein [Rubrivivax sp. RP6-9]|uniref:CsgG/HfaB family protein n=1 Tax=Rubrivivax sp. RP6-9 TaxID=3415750 RepID=UPI003CC5C459